MDRGTFIFSFFSVGPGCVHVFFAEFLLLPECLSEVHCCAIFCIPPLNPSGRPPDWGWGQTARFSFPADPPTVRSCPRWSKSHGNHRCGRLACSGSLLLHLPVKQFDCSAGRLPGSGRFLWRVPWTVLADTLWAWSSFMTLSWQSFSTLTAISAMDTVAVRFLWSVAATARSPVSPFDNLLYSIGQKKSAMERKIPRMSLNI